jgi:hypothetical protein
MQRTQNGAARQFFEERADGLQTAAQTASGGPPARECTTGAETAKQRSAAMNE